MRVEEKQRRATLRHYRVRKKVHGTSERPRMSVCFTNKHIYVQFIDDERGVTLAATSTRDKELPERGKVKANVAGAVIIGKRAAEVALKAGITKVVFDRGSNKYHGKVKALADAAREAGLKF
jgi:large subunit ribosomal protein L18